MRPPQCGFSFVSTADYQLSLAGKTGDTPSSLCLKRKQKLPLSPLRKNTSYFGQNWANNALFPFYSPAILFGVSQGASPAAQPPRPQPRPLSPHPVAATVVCGRCPGSLPSPGGHAGGNQLLFCKDFIYLFLERGWEGDMMYQRNSCRLPLAVPQPGTWPSPQACGLSRESIRRPFDPQACAQPWSHPSQGGN